MRFKERDTPLEAHSLKEWASESGEFVIVVAPIIGAVRVQLYHYRPEFAYPDILQCTWDTPPDGRLWSIIADILTALGELDDTADGKAVQTRLCILMYEWYGDIFDGSRARPIDRDHPDYNPHANPWWNDAQALREEMETGICRHHVPLNLDLPPLGEMLSPIDTRPTLKEWELQQHIETTGEEVDWTDRPERDPMWDPRRPNPPCTMVNGVAVPAYRRREEK